MASMWVKVLAGGFFAAAVGSAIGESIPVEAPSESREQATAKPKVSAPKEPVEALSPPSRSSPEPVEPDIYDTPAVRQLSAVSAMSGGTGDGLGALIALNGYLCAEPVDTRPLKVRHAVFEVTCIEYRGGSGTVRYLVDGNAGTVSEL